MKKYLFILLVILTSCNDALFDTGELISKEYALDEFNEIYINDIFDVFLKQDTICKLKIEGGSNLVPNINFKIKDNKLSIEDDNNANWSRNYERIKLYISVKKISFLKINESANVKTIDTLIAQRLTVYSINDYSDISITVKCDDFIFINEGTSGGYLTVKGKASYSGIWARGSCTVDAIDFLSEKTVIKNESIGDCYVNVSNILDAKIFRLGNIYYKGNPKTINYTQDNSTGQLINID